MSKDLEDLKDLNEMNSNNEEVNDKNFDFFSKKKDAPNSAKNSKFSIRDILNSENSSNQTDIKVPHRSNQPIVHHRNLILPPFVDMLHNEFSWHPLWLSTNYSISAAQRNRNPLINTAKQADLVNLFG
ncbi:unnamed protein product [Dracunculus medinensis]|uniref:Uncharacterized protein n=1 Tax=Dracunculus medinensis TaxID=318479 RepID=A0A0N4U5B6_DRAME|nr:unnamed protein product [Dracunculus medinensis]